MCRCEKNQVRLQYFNNRVDGLNGFAAALVPQLVDRFYLQSGHKYSLKICVIHSVIFTVRRKRQLVKIHKGAIIHVFSRFVYSKTFGNRRRKIRECPSFIVLCITQISFKHRTCIDIVVMQFRDLFVLALKPTCINLRYFLGSESAIVKIAAFCDLQYSIFIIIPSHKRQKKFMLPDAFDLFQFVIIRSIRRKVIIAHVCYLSFIHNFRRKGWFSFYTVAQIPQRYNLRIIAVSIAASSFSPLRSFCPACRAARRQRTPGDGIFAKHLIQPYNECLRLQRLAPRLILLSESASCNCVYISNAQCVIPTPLTGHDIGDAPFSAHCLPVVFVDADLPPLYNRLRMSK